MGKRIGMLGGTFDPIHYGHLKIAEKAYEEFNLDEVIFIPTGNSYMKENVTDASSRLDMVKLAVEPYKGFSVSDIEIKRSGNTYSYETILALKELHKASTIFFIMGMDSLVSLKNWYKPEIILSNSVILVAVREALISDLEPVIEEYKAEYECDIQIISMDSYDISSTQIRNNIRNNVSVKDMLPANELAYINEKKLYR